MALGRKAFRLAGLLAALVLCYTLALLAVYAIPDEAVKPAVDAAVAVLEEEGNMTGGYATYFWHNGFGITDNLTDKTMYRGLLRNGRSVVDAAMRTDYARYWHGYAVFMRPLCTLFSIINIRYLNMMLLMALFVLCYWHCRRRLGAWTAFGFAAGLLMSFILIAPFCQQYVTVYTITLLACYAILRWWERLRSCLAEVFLALGSLVCFFDFLTFPVLALGYPLLLCLLLQCQQGKGGLWGHTIGLSALWMGGYALTWLSKALAGGMLTGQNVLADILSQASTRMTGGVDNGGSVMEITMLDAVIKNLETFFMGSNVVFLLLLAAAFGLRALLRRERAVQWLRALPLAAVGMYPLVWYCVMRNHVRLHFWMTNKMMAVSVFAICAYLCAVTRGGWRDESAAAKLDKGH